MDQYTVSYFLIILGGLLMVAPLAASTYKFIKRAEPLKISVVSYAGILTVMLGVFLA